MPKVIPKNDYEICGEVTKLFLTKRDGSVIEALISTTELDRVKNYKHRWCVSSSTNGYKYAQTTIKYPDGKVSIQTLHRFITDAPDGLVVDHINRNTLDNRNENLRVVKQQENCQNRKMQKNNKTGVRGVYWRADQKRYIARVKIKGKYIFIGGFAELEEAEKAVKKARSEMMPYSQEAM